METILSNVRKQSKKPKIGTRGKNIGHQCNYKESFYINAKFAEGTELGESASCDTTFSPPPPIEMEGRWTIVKKKMRSKILKMTQLLRKLKSQNVSYSKLFK